MPSRDANTGGRPMRNNGGSGARATQQQPEPEVTRKEAVTGDDVWDDIEGMKGSGGDGTFDKLNTAFFMRDADPEVEVIFIDENPTVFYGHNIKCVSDAGKTFYRTEQCQKSEQEYCVYCDASTNNKSVGKANKTIGFRLLDPRGKWDSKAGALNGIPTPKIFLSPIYFAKQIKVLKDEAGGAISDKIIKINRNGNYIPSFKMERLSSGGFDYAYVDEEIFDGMELPEILDVYAPLNDEDALEFLDKFSAKPGAPAPTQQSNRAVGTFGSSANTRGSRSR